MPVDALALPLLVVTALGVLGYSLALRRYDGPGARTGWFLLALIVLATALAYFTLGERAGFIGFGLYTLTIVAPFWLRLRLQRAYVAGDERSALRIARLIALIHPTRVARDELASLPTLLALRAGDDIPPAELDRIAAGDADTRRTFDVVVLHNRRDVDAVRAAFADSQARDELLAQGLGGPYVQAVALTDPDGDRLAEAFAHAIARDPSLRQPERHARLILQAHALAGDVASTRCLLDALGMYLERGDRPLLLALAQWCAGEPAAARATLERGLGEVGDHRVARATLASLAAMFDRRPPRPATTASPALERRLAALRRDIPVLRALAPFLGRHARRPHVTHVWSAVLVVSFILLEATGDSLDPDHLYDWGALAVDFFGLDQAWRLATATLLHAGLLHLLLNVLMLWRFGGFVEALYGRARLIALYVLGAALSGLSVVWFGNEAHHLLVGASGAIMALGGAVLAALLVRRDLRATPIGRTELRVLVILFVLQVVFDLTTPEVSATAHASGIVSGLVLGSLLLPRTDPVLTTLPQRPAPAPVP